MQYGSEPSIILPVPGSIGNPAMESIAKPAYPTNFIKPVEGYFSNG